jgi:hypothetical protein
MIDTYPFAWWGISATCTAHTPPPPISNNKMYEDSLNFSIHLLIRTHVK